MDFCCVAQAVYWIWVVVCQQHVDIGWVKVVSSVHLVFNFSDVVDGLLLRCTGSGIGSVSLFVGSILTLDGSKLFPACICFCWESGAYSRSTCEVKKAILLFFTGQYASIKLEGQNVRFETLLEALWSLLGGFGGFGGRSGGPFGDVLEPLGRFARLLEGFWDSLGGVLGASCHPLGASWKLLRRCWRLLVEF